MSLHSALEIARVQRKGALPRGCNALAASTDPEALIHAILTGNRPTRRKALRNLRKVIRANEKVAFINAGLFDIPRGKKP